MPATDSSSNGAAPATRAGGDRDHAARAGERERTIASLTVAVGELRRGAAALKAENRELRAEIAGLEREAAARRSGDAAIGELTRPAEIALPPGGTGDPERGTAGVVAADRAGRESGGRWDATD